MKNIIPTPRPGDLVYCQKNIFIRHTGVYLGNGLILQNTPESGEHFVDWNGFTQGREVRIKSMNLPAQVVIERASEILRNPKKYDSLFNNCEHTASRVTSGVARSEHVGALVLLGLLIFAARK